MADNAPVLIWVSGTDKLCYFFNAGWLRFTGRSLAQEYGNGWTDGVHPEDLERCLEIYTRSFDAREEFQMEYRLKRFDGEYRWLLDKGVPRYASDGAFAGYIGSCMDIDELLESERVKKDFTHTHLVEREQALNEELAASNEELVAINEDLQKAQQDLQQLNEQLEVKVASRTKALKESEEQAQSLNEELTASNEELMAINEEMTAMNEELAATNEELYESQQHLQRTNAELTESEARLKIAIEATLRSERLFKSIALNIPRSLIIVIDRQHRYVAVEGDLMARMGYDSKDYVGKHPLETSAAERYEASQPLYERVLAGETFSVERKAATGEDYLVHFVPLNDEQETAYAGLIIALDITEIKQAQEKSAKLAAIIESSDDAIISKTLDSVITSWNDSAQRIFGYTAEEVIGETIYKLIPEDRMREEPEIIARIRSGERIEHFETKRRTKDGRLIDVSVTISPVFDPQGKIIGVSKIARDITERKLDEARKNDFIGMVSHELKTPLTSLGAIIQVANSKLKGSSDTFIAGAMENAGRQVRRMTAMINGFLNISRLESGKLHIDKQSFDLEELVAEVVSEISLAASSHEIRVKTTERVMIHADRDKIGSVLTNLISNAVKYSPKEKLIEINCRITGEVAEVSVKDQGMGIKPEDIPHVFDRYYRVANSHTQHISGFGIGLYLSAEIIERHDGRIWVESKNGVGSTFYFSLPLR